MTETNIKVRGKRVTSATVGRKLAEESFRNSGPCDASSYVVIHGTGEDAKIYQRTNYVCMGGYQPPPDISQMFFYPSMRIQEGMPQLRNGVTQKAIDSIMTSDEEWPARYRRYHEWLINDEVFGESFITKNLKLAMKSGYRMNINLPSWKVHSSIILCRVAYEDPYMIKFWDKYVLAGGHPRMGAFLMYSVRGLTDSRLAFDKQLTGHYPYRPAHMSQQAVVRLVANELPDIKLTGCTPSETRPYSQGRSSCSLAFDGLPGEDRDWEKIRDGLNSGGTGTFKKNQICHRTYDVFKKDYPCFKDLDELVHTLLQYEASLDMTNQQEEAA